MGTKTISFVATEELADRLETEASRRMTSVSAAAQQLLAEQLRADQPDQEEPAETDDEETGDGDPFEEHPEKWHEPDGEKYAYAVAVPGSADVADAGKKRYYKTRDGAEEGLNRWWS